MLKKVLSILVLALTLMLTVVSCSSQKDMNGMDIGGQEEHGGKKAKRIDNINYSVWTTYWDTSDLEYEIEKMKENISQICYFAAYFDQSKKVFIPEQVTESFKKVRTLYGSKEYKHYLTFVNDLLLESNKSSLKDVNLLYSLLETKESREKHIEEIIYLASKEGFQGIEIDYEAIKKDFELWELFIRFIIELYTRTENDHLSLRVVLEPNAPLDRINLPEGPEYVMMCYNLHDYGTVPGPKANKKFIEDLVRKTETLPGRVNFALATGGYDFQENGLVNSLTEREATELALLHEQSPLRDEESRALVFSYKDSQGVNHEVWYADKETIDYWIDIIWSTGNDKISLWKIGGNLTLFGT
ncbi:MAG TPA: glycosyl hydrolase [Peptococcaceae bacterium]|nr:glycosyl hydrolase [Peptococcaceae bacterium]